ncbi:MAG: UDP-2,3-diacylglucosamine diphosphatase LpxI [Thermoguttaceae bacterium]|nr:UDP-2,3-diacylglucosamine diphosphatase LpxI [Thermoguttaceae bacterium]MDW8080192.1 UDP-2,3-diacylglucosamine diphosphatase LpxI [Thermoguttaceae bacterium]
MKAAADASSRSLSPRRGPIGLLAGWGDLPVVVASALSRAGWNVFCVGVRDHVNPAIAQHCTGFCVLGLGRVGGAVRYFRRHGVTDATMVGKIFKTLILRPGLVLRELPDWLTIRSFAPHFLFRLRDCRDDSLLGRLVQVFGRKGIAFRPATDYVPDLLISPGVLTTRKPTRAEWADIRFGWRMAKGIGRLDIGQTVCVKNLTVLAVEAIEGTDECIRRAGVLTGRTGFAVVKVAKPQQDMRFDVPTVGPLTIRTMVEAGAKVLAVEAGKTILLHPDEFLSLANEHRIAVVALPHIPPEPEGDCQPSAEDA